MSLLIRKPGILTTLQDGGRFGHRSFGINPSGAMDTASMRLINTLLENDPNEAVLETHFPAAETVFETECSFAIGGADFGPLLNENSVENWAVLPARKGDTLRFQRRQSGCRAYIAIAGGFKVEPWLGSKSTNLAAKAGGFNGRSLAAGDRLEFAQARSVKSRRLGPSLTPRSSDNAPIQILKGAEFGLLTGLSEQRLLEKEFLISPLSNRMGFRLIGEPLDLLPQRELISSGVTFGTVQLLPDGQLIVLMADHQTTGGYPRIANVASADLPSLAQHSPGDPIRFALISQEQAERSIADFERNLAFLRVGIRFAS